MKTINSLLSSFLFATLISCGPNVEKQDVKVKQQSDFDGILEFQINKTTINDLNLLKYKSKEINRKREIEDKIKEEGVIYVSNWDLLCDGIRKFKLDNFKNGTINFSDVVLTFYKDTLVDFSSSVDNDMNEILRAKYPNYEHTSENKNYRDYWYNESITASWWYSSKYGENFFIYDSNITKELREKTEKAKADYLIKENKGL